MSNTLETAHHFIDACETGKGWDFCSTYCHQDATFSSQIATLESISSLESYCEWVKNLLIIVSDGKYELKFTVADELRNCVAAIGVIKGTHTVEGGPIPPTGNYFVADYAYNIEFKNGLISHMTKIWNDTMSLQQLGWS